MTNDSPCPDAEVMKPHRKAGAAVERLVAAVHKKLGPAAEVRWDETINECQIDASVRGVLNGHSMLIIVECKHFGSANVGKPIIDKLHSVMQQTKANKAVLVTSTGYTAPALKFAMAVGIDTCVLRPAQSADVPGDGELLQQVTFQINLLSTVLEDIEEFESNAAST